MTLSRLEKKQMENAEMKLCQIYLRERLNRLYLTEELVTWKIRQEKLS